MTIQWPQWWCAANGQSLLKWQKITSLLQKDIGTPDLMACNPIEFLEEMGSQVFEPIGRISPEWPGLFQNMTYHALYCADSYFEGYVLGIPPSLIWEVLSWNPAQKWCWKSIPKLAAVLFPSMSKEAESFVLADCQVFIHSEHCSSS